MSEMLGNQYFLTHRFLDARKELQEALQKNPSNKCIQKRLIICYIKTGRYNEAFELFYNLVSKDIRFITNSDYLKEGCPCRDIIAELEAAEVTENDTNKILSLAILWLYCDPLNSIKYFEMLRDETYKTKINRLINKINHLVSTTN
ncbi:MAG: tetratricopeptide repeat protein [Melioribacteraceae bacterium]|nr:tetratricopeptide repeat protein [Melioribacteraceae bacterium]MCF8354065.1 tetratricopeptide repeat protein [Melioribacteraceae bacterium]MCF8393737.1 tetratricopeptide repeat protein [Melioribacteraceae bacterium]MCF8419481.1 tetratricopeptide repeat protein [Melioribacteraceae bacterium]